MLTAAGRSKQAVVQPILSLALV